MICPEDKIQMHQDSDRNNIPLGGGTWSGDVYETWTIQVCPHCEIRVRETYRAEKLYKEIKI